MTFERKLTSKSLKQPKPESVIFEPGTAHERLWTLTPSYTKWTKPADEPLYIDGERLTDEDIQDFKEGERSLRDVEVLGENESKAKGLRLEYLIEYTRHVRYAFGDIFQTFADFMNAVDRARVEAIEPTASIGNKSDLRSPEEIVAEISWQATYPRFKNEAFLNKLQTRIEQNLPMDMPIVLEHPNGNWWLMSGNTRFGLAVVNKMPTIKVLVIPVPEV
jgi:hypothetical protein